MILGSGGSRLASVTPKERIEQEESIIVGEHASFPSQSQ